jgi:protein-S-isoprenylcysteine O-methyltransferase Ste14
MSATRCTSRSWRPFVGQALIFGQLVLLGYAVAAALVMAAFAHLYEEPALADQFGAEYESYRRAVPAWWPRPHPWERDGERGACARESD